MQSSDCGIHALPGHALRAARPSQREGEPRSQRGSITIWGIGLTLVIAAFAGLVIDTWRVFAERQDLSGMADSAAIAGATAVDIDHLNETGEVILDLSAAELRALEYLERQDGWSAEITFVIVTAADGSALTVTLEKDVDFTLLGPLLPGEDPLRIAVTSRASPNVVAP
ncbi:MAG: Tad domain-containing protein [Acidimicrobiia bacterium]|nr:Tad domain-containing protein [Acidimicrobiia bacterium]